MKKQYSTNLVVLPDVHGAATQMQKSFDSLREFQNDWKRKISDCCPKDLSPMFADRNKYVSLGDLVDRGSDSLGVLQKVSAMVNSREMDFSYLCGNHEAMFFRFLFDSNPNSQLDFHVNNLRLFLLNGGLHTLVSLTGLAGAPQSQSFIYDSHCLKRSQIDGFLDKYMGYISDLRVFLLYNPLIRSFFEGMQLSIKHEDDLCVHAGFMPGFLFQETFGPAYGWLESLNGRFKDAVAAGMHGDFSDFSVFNQASASRGGSGPAGPLWASKRDIFGLSDSAIDLLSLYLSVEGVNTMYVGHSVVSDVFRFPLTADQKIIFTDTGMTPKYTTGFDSQIVIRDSKGDIYHIDSWGQFNITD